MTTTKSSIIDDLGEHALLLPARVNQALVANEQAKYLFSLLQNALLQAARPELEVDALAREREAVGIEDVRLDEVVETARTVESGCLIADFDGIRERLFALVRQMLEPLRPEAPDDTRTDEVASCAARLEALERAVPATRGAPVAPALVECLTRGTRDAGDSLHVLVMDLHKALNRLQRAVAEEDVAGASVYRLDDAQRGLVEAFMAGVQRTAPLRFGHPGLGTTATSIGDKLMVQNDIGTTDAHVFVLEVTARTASFTYTDVHLPRLEFFKSLLEPFALAWQDTASRAVSGFEHDSYYLCRGRFEAPDDASLARFLEWLGSRLVFLIDWNKARKRLRELVRKKDAVLLLKWAADHEHGHRAFLELGAEQLVYQAIEHAASGEPRYGQPLTAILGEQQTLDFLRYTLATTATGLLARRDRRLIEEAIRAEMRRYFRSVPEEQLALAARHGEYVFEAADLVRVVLQGLDGAPRDADFGARALRRAAGWERAADGIVNEVRAMGRRSAARPRLRVLVEEQDDAVDALEEGVFLATLVTARHAALPAAVREGLVRLVEEAVGASQALNKALDAARHVHRAGAREDVEDFFQAFEEVVDLEHRTDASERLVTAALVEMHEAAGVLHVAARLCAGLEAAADTLSHCVHMLRDYLVDEVMAA
ncbi:MAG: DUF47 family protein [Gammaproteobacteria bacterium]